MQVQQLEPATAADNGQDASQSSDLSAAVLSHMKFFLLNAPLAARVCMASSDSQAMEVVAESAIVCNCVVIKHKSLEACPTDSSVDLRPDWMLCGTRVHG